MGWDGMGLLANRVGLGWNGFTGHPLTAADEERAFQLWHRQPPWRFRRRAEAVEVEENKGVPVIRTRRANQGELVSTHHHQPRVQKRLPIDHAVIVLLHDEQGSDAPAKLIVAQVHGEEAQVDVQGDDLVPEHHDLVDGSYPGMSRPRVLLVIAPDSPNKQPANNVVGADEEASLGR